MALRYSGCGLALAGRRRYAACRRNRQREEVAPVQTHPEFPNLFLLDHPLIQHKLTLLRCADTPTGLFRELLKETALLMGYEVTRPLPMTTVRIETPLVAMEAPVLAGKTPAIV